MMKKTNGLREAIMRCISTIKGWCKKILSFIKKDLYNDYFKEGLWPHFFLRIKSTLTDREINIRSAALTFYTLSGLIPFCALITWVKDIVQTKISVSKVFSSMLPTMEDSFTELRGLSNLKIHNLLDSFPGVIALLVILLSTHLLFNNIQAAFNYIWRSKEREPSTTKVTFNVLSALTVTATVLTGATLIQSSESNAVHFLTLFIMVWGLLCAAFVLVPYDKKPKILPAVFSSLVTTFFLAALTKVTPMLMKSLIDLEFKGISLFFLIFWIFWSWFIIMIGAKLCSIIDKSGPYYLRNEIDELAVEYRIFLTIFVVAAVFKRAKTSVKGSTSITFNELRQCMFSIKDKPGCNANVFLPMPLLDSIIDELCHKQIIVRKQELSGVSYYANEEFTKDRETIDSFTVGDLLLKLLFSGNYYLRFPYQQLLHPLEANLTTNLLVALSKLDKPIVEIEPDKDFEHMGIEYSREDAAKVAEDKEKEYKMWLNNEFNECESYYRQALHDMTAEALKEGLKAAPQELEPNLQFHLDLIDRLASEVQTVDDAETPSSSC